MFGRAFTPMQLTTGVVQIRKLLQMCRKRIDPRLYPFLANDRDSNEDYIREWRRHHPTPTSMPSCLLVGAIRP